jgi:hypothetical protein
VFDLIWAISSGVDFSQSYYGSTDLAAQFGSTDGTDGSTDGSTDGCCYTN